jgi:hypothetical protein
MSFNLTSNQLVASAMRKLSVLGDGQSPSTTQLANGTEALNAMLKTFQTKGMPLWAISESDVPLTATRVYPLSYKPLKVVQALLVDGDTVQELDQKTHVDYNRLAAGTGDPVAYWYETTGILHLWPTPVDTTKSVRIVYQRQVNDMVNGTDTLDFPVYWHEAVIYGLAHRLAPEFGIPLADRKTLATEAEYFLNEALSFGTEEGSMYISPNWNGR